MGVGVLKDYQGKLGRSGQKGKRKIGEGDGLGAVRRKYFKHG